MKEKRAVTKAVAGDVQEIQKLVNENAQKGQMLALSLSEIYEQLRDFYVCRQGGEVVGACALHVVWDDLAEIRSLAVKEGLRRRGLGRRLVEAALKEAAALGVRKVFALTYQREFFRDLGFAPVEKTALPHKIWNDCLKCVKFPDCDEEAFIIELREG